MAETVAITPTDLAESARKYRKELLQMPVIGLEESSKHMSIRPGVRYKETVGQIGGDIQFRPYSDTAVDQTDLTIKGRTLETFFGSVVKNFKPNDIYKSFWGSSITKGESLKSVEIARLVLSYLAGQLGKNLNKVLFSAVRSDTGATSAQLFNGFDTICTTESGSGGGLTAANGNYVAGTTVISSSNAVEILKTVYRSASDELRAENTKMFISQTIYDNYVDDYQSTVGSVPYNTQFDKTTLEGSQGRCELVPLSNKSTSPFIQLTTQSNMLIGVDQMSDSETIEVEKHSPFVLQFVATMFIGCQFESISKERLLVYKLKTA